MDTAALGDPFLLPLEFALSSCSEIVRRFGDTFATQLQHLELGFWMGPIAAFGNSDGDLQMLQWTAAGSGPHFCLYSCERL